MPENIKILILLIVIIGLTCLGVDCLVMDYEYSALRKIFKKVKQFFTIKPTKMFNYRAFVKAMQFMFIPTFSFLLVLYVWFFDWSKFSTFVTSDSWMAQVLRVVCLLAEILLVYRMYEHYEVLYPDTKRAEKIEDSILHGTNITRHLKAHRNGNRAIDAYSNRDVATAIDTLLPPFNEQYKVEIYVLNNIPNTIVLTTKPSE